MGKIRGTNPTFNQRRILEQNQKDSNDYLYVRTRISQDENKYLNKTSDKKEYMIFVNKNNGEELEIELH